MICRSIHVAANGIIPFFLWLSNVLSRLSCLTLCNPVDSSPPGSSVRGDSPGTNTGVGCHALLQGIQCIYIYGPHLPYPFICWWMFMLLPYLGYCQVLQYTLGFPLLQFFGKSFRRIVVNSSLNVWQNLPMKSSGLELLFVGRSLVTVSISVLEIEQVCFLSSWFSLRRLHLSKNLAISSRLSILLAYSCL